MSDVQPENGYCRIANELLDAIVAYPFTKRQYALVLAIVRRTYGYNKKVDTTTVWRLADACGIGRQHASVALQELAAMNVITLRDSTRFSHGQPMKEVGIQKDYSMWGTVPETGTDTVPKTGTVPKTATVPETGVDRTQNRSPTVPKTGHTKDIHKRQPKDTPPPARVREDRDDLVPVSWQPDDTSLTRLRMAGITGPPTQDQIQSFIAYWRGQQRHVNSPNQITEWFVKWMVGEKQRSKNHGTNQQPRKFSAVERNRASIERVIKAGNFRE